MKTKAKRLEYQQAQFNSLINHGFKQEVYSGLNIFTQEKNNRFYLKVFKDTAADPICYKQYSSLESMQKAIDGYKSSYDRNKAYKAELKANPTKSSAANCAAAIRQELKKSFPDIKFSVKSDNFSGGNSVHIEWTNGPTDDQVRDIVRKYQYGSFNSMDDMYEITNNRTDIPQAKYVQTRREISEDVNKIVFDHLRGIYSEDTPDYEVNRMVYQIVYKSPIPARASVTGVARTNKSFGLADEVYRLAFDKAETTEVENKATTEPNYTKVETKPGEVSIVDYSAKAIAVIGDTKPIKDQLKDLGGKFNFRLSCGAGWVFPKSKLTDVQTLLSA